MISRPGEPQRKGLFVVRSVVRLLVVLALFVTSAASSHAAVAKPAARHVWAGGMPTGGWGDWFKSWTRGSGGDADTGSKWRNVAYRAAPKPVRP